MGLFFLNLYKNSILIFLKFMKKKIKNLGYNGASGHQVATSIPGAPYSGGQGGQSNWNYNYYG